MKKERKKKKEEDETRIYSSQSFLKDDIPLWKRPKATPLSPHSE